MVTIYDVLAMEKNPTKFKYYSYALILSIMKQYYKIYCKSLNFKEAVYTVLHEMQTVDIR